MTTKALDADKSVAQIKAEADAKLARLRQSPGFESFYSDAVIEAFKNIESSAYAGKSRPLAR
jgi:tellurite resistance protein